MPQLLASSQSVLEVRPSQIAGLGAFALRPIPKGMRIIEYRGELISSAEADRRYAGGSAAHPIVLLFSLNERLVIDAGVDGNEARFINHSCEPNCEAVTQRRRVWILALRNIHAGEELTYDYNLIGDDLDRQRELEIHACHCGAETCRGTMFRLG